jgi:hypothetical protein
MTDNDDDNYKCISQTNVGIYLLSQICVLEAKCSLKNVILYVFRKYYLLILANTTYNVYLMSAAEVN